MTAIEKVKKEFDRAWKELEKKGADEDEEIVSFDYMSKESLENNVNDILSMGDEEAKKRKSNGQYISVLSNTPKVIVDNVTNAKDREIIMRFDALYLAVRHDGALEGHYHNFGKNFSQIITNVLNSPDAIIIMDNGRLNLLATIKSPKGNYTVISVEMNSVKDIDNEYKAYNVVISMLPAKDNYIRNLNENRAVNVKYKKEDLLQVNPQLYKWLSVVNKKSSDTTVPQKAQSVNTIISEKLKNDTL